MDDCFGDDYIAMRIEQDKQDILYKIHQRRRECANQGIECKLYIHQDMGLHELKSIYREMPKPLGVH